MRSVMKVLLSSVLAACLAASSSCGGGSTAAQVIAAVLGSADGMFAIATVTRGDEDVADAQVAVNNAVLTYGLPINFTTDDGLLVDLTLPVYYASLSGVAAGDELSLSARDPSGALIYQSGAVTMPGQVDLIAPGEGDSFSSDSDVSMRWGAASGAQAYVASYEEVDAYDGDPLEEESDAGDDGEEYEGDDAGLYLDFVASGTTQMTVPSSSTVAGSAEFSVTAFSSDDDLFEVGDFTNVFVAGTYDYADATITDAAAQVLDKQVEGSQGLAIVKEYSKNVEGLRFHVREGNPQQITAPGTVTIGFKMRRYKVSVAWIQAYDINGNMYFNWIKKRIYKSKKKKYYPAFSVSPGTTVVFGTHDASYRGGTYSY